MALVDAGLFLVDLKLTRKELWRWLGAVADAHLSALTIYKDKKKLHKPIASITIEERHQYSLELFVAISPVVIGMRRARQEFWKK